MNKFMVVPNTLKQQGEKILDIHQIIIPNVINEVKNIYHDLSLNSIDLDNHFRSINEKLTKANKEIKQLGDTIIEIAMLYEHTDSEITITNGELCKNEDNEDIPLACPTDATPSEDYVSPEDYVATIEYSYSEDNIRVPMCSEFLYKEYCMEMAKRIMNEHGDGKECNNMSTRRIAKEIYAHALGYYAASALQSFGFNSELIQGIIECGEIADVGKGDRLEIFYNVIWYWMEPFDIGPTYF